MKKNDQKFYKILVFLVLAVTIFCLYNIMFKNVTNVSGYFYSYIIIYLFLTIFALYREKDNIFNIRTIFLGLYTIFIGLSPVFYFFKYHNFIANIGNDICYQFIWNIIGYLGLIIGLSLTKRKDIKKTELSEEELKFSYFISIILLIVSLVVNLVFIINNMNIYFGGNLIDESLSAISGNGLVVQLMGLYSVGLCMMYNYCYLTKKRYVLFIFFLITIATLLILKGGRTSIVLIFISILLTKNSYERIKVSSVLRFTIFILIIIATLGLLKASMSGVSNTFINNINGDLSVGAINLNYIKNTFPNRVPFQYGKTLLINIKMLAPGPDIDFTLWLKQQIGIQFAGGGVTPTLIGEGYINGGIIGIFIWPLFAGILANYLNKKYEYDKSNLVWIVCLISRLLDIFRGGFANSSIGVLILLLEFIFYKLTFSIAKKKV